jgi:hypothetical protein
VKRPVSSPTTVSNPAPAVPEIEIDLTPLQPVESRFLAALAPFVPSPRSATRLLNLYRMLRSTENLSVVSRFLSGADGSEGEFQAVALLLGMQTAAPELFSRLLDAPCDLTAGIVGGLLNRPTEGSWASLVDGLRPRRVDERWRNDLGDLGAEERDAWQRLLVDLGQVTPLVRLDGLTALRAWAPHVARFSFHLRA